VWLIVKANVLQVDLRAQRLILGPLMVTVGVSVDLVGLLANQIVIWELIVSARLLLRVLLVNTAKVKALTPQVETVWRATIAWVVQCDLIQRMTQRELVVQKEHTVRPVPRHPQSAPLEHTQTSLVPQPLPFAWLAPLA